MADFTDNHADVLVIGGGISGLYMANRLVTATSSSVLVIECSARFGGRFHTVHMPGGFNAELGAMRVVPDHHPIIDHLVRELNLSDDRIQLYFPPDGQQEITRWYFRNQHIHNHSELQKLFAISPDALPYLNIDPSLIEYPSDGNPSKAIIHGSRQLVKNITTGTLGLPETMNAELFNFRRSRNLTDGGTDPVSSSATATSFFNAKGSGGAAFTLRHGMESIVKRLVERLTSDSKAKLIKSSRAVQVEELEGSFRVKSVSDTGSEIWYTCDKLILACNAQGIRKISWVSEFIRTLNFELLFDQVCPVRAVKIFMTFNCKWWEECGMYCGNLETDLPIGYASIFGTKDNEGEGLHTILAGYTWNYHCIPVFEGLNSSDEERFVNASAEIPNELTPSRRLVDEVRRQLAAAFGCKEVPEPVCALVKFWSGDPIGSAAYAPKVGVDHNNLHWKSLKPFDSSDVYLAGDTFCPITESRGLSRWSESALLTSERILHKYFHLDPFTENLTLTNQWPDGCKM